MRRMRTLLVFLCVSLMVLISSKIKAQIFINEFLASNTGLTVDPDFNESGDWLELYNSGTSTFSIGGYYISDNFNDSIKWQIPFGTKVEAGGYLIIWADGFNTGLHTSFKLSADGEELAIFSPTGEIIDSLTYPYQESNISMGRKGDGGSEWVYFLHSTPGAKNSIINFEGVVQSVPQYSVLGGIFTSPVSIGITNTFGGDIRYTLDGSEPNYTSNIANNTLVIDSTTVVRSRIFQTGKIPGEIITNTYFIDAENKIGSMPVVSISSNPENFWDSSQGIYVQDFKPDWEIPVNIELFENDGSDRAGFNLQAGVKVNGLYSWKLPQKMLGVYFRKSYGEGNLDYPLFFDRERKNFDSFALRASGSDWAYTLFRDGMAQSLGDENMDVDFQGYRACVVYVNGEYMGIHNMRSKVDEDFIIKNRQLGDQKIDMIENENYVEEGSLDQYASFEELYKSGLTNQANYDLVAEQMDIENFTDFIITEIYSRNTSVDHNIMTWKPQTEGKWKWILNDLDRGFFSPGNTLINYYAERNVIPLRQLLENEGYKKYFGKRLADHLYTTFEPNRVKAIIDNFKVTIKDQIPNHVERWAGTSSSYGDPIPSFKYWENEVNKLKTFAEVRPPVLLADLENYGFDSSESLSIAIFPENAGGIHFNGMEIKQSNSEGAYPTNEEIRLEAKAKAGYEFRGWAKENTETIIATEAIWRYYDRGETLPGNWILNDFPDSNWKEGKAELGYGDGDENTIISFGDDSNNKHITSYFRKLFTVENLDEIRSVKIRLKCDDGAVVYLNGKEIGRENLPETEIDRLTKALSSVSSSTEDDFTTYIVDKSILETGINTIAAEVHQISATSSDISFDLELTAVSIDSGELLSANKNYSFTHTKSESLIALFARDESCIVPEEISAELILDKSCSPYKVPNNVLVKPTGKLIIEAGVELLFSDDISIEINGSLEVNGMGDEPVVFKSNPESVNKKWGIINFVDADTSYLKNVVIEDASKGSHPLREIAAISAFKSVLTLDNVTIENVFANPLLGRYSDVTVLNSSFHSAITGDLINLKYGKGFIDNCKFEGNSMPDTDAIDYDDVENGVIQNCEIYNFLGFNSDGIDIGEKTKNVTIKNVVTTNITDKGISLGQQSTASISNSVFVNCNKGIAVKDSCYVIIDHCTFYNNGTSVACYEKNVGDAGGNAIVTNSILSNVYDASYFSDSKSTIIISNSVSDNTALPAGRNNLFVDPQLSNPNLFDFSLLVSSPCIAAGSDGNIGANLNVNQVFNQIFISSIAYNASFGSEDLEFLVLSNTGTEDLDISNFEFTKGFTFRFPEDTKIPAGQKIYITNNADASFWFNKNLNVYQWESGRLADEGETVKLVSPEGIVIDYIKYSVDNTWPEATEGEAISLVSDKVDNHIGSNWEIQTLLKVVSIEKLIANTDISIYPNPTNGIIHLSGIEEMGIVLNVYNLSGIKVFSKRINSSNSQIDLSNYPSGMYFFQLGSFSQKIILRK